METRKACTFPLFGFQITIYRKIVYFVKVLIHRQTQLLWVKALSVFVVLGNWTDQGIRNITEAPERAKVANDMVKNAGGKMQTFYTLGKYDFVAIIELPKDDDVMAILLCLGSMGNIRTTTMKAWTESEVAKIISAPHP
jgi:uncharacterized protein with GYD domain